MVHHDIFLWQLSELDGAISPAGEEVATVIDGHLGDPGGWPHAAEECVLAVLPRERETKLVGVHGPHLCNTKPNNVQ